jgi:F-type H+-transporting ATPase subunit epsilon
MQCLIVTPEQTVLDRSADFVAIQLLDGEIGIAPDHAPMIGRLGYGEMRVYGEGRTERYYVEGGFVEVLDDVVSVLTPRALEASAIDPAVAKEQLTSAQSRAATTPEARAARTRAVAQARAQLRVAQRG